MENLNKGMWPVLIVSEDLGKKSDSGFWLEQIIEQLEYYRNCPVIFSASCNEVYAILSSGQKLGGVLVEKELVSEELSDINRMSLSVFDPEIPVKRYSTDSASLLNIVRSHDKEVPTMLMSSHCSIEEIPYEILENVDEIVWKFSDTPECLAGKIADNVVDYAEISETEKTGCRQYRNA